MDPILRTALSAAAEIRTKAEAIAGATSIKHRRPGRIPL